MDITVRYTNGAIETFCLGSLAESKELYNGKTYNIVYRLRFDQLYEFEDGRGDGLWLEVDRSVPGSDGGAYFVPAYKQCLLPAAALDVVEQIVVDKTVVYQRFADVLVNCTIVDHSNDEFDFALAVVKKAKEAVKDPDVYYDLDEMRGDSAYIDEYLAHHLGLTTSLYRLALERVGAHEALMKEASERAKEEAQHEHEEEFKAAHRIDPESLVGLKTDEDEDTGRDGDDGDGEEAESPSPLDLLSGFKMPSASRADDEADEEASGEDEEPDGEPVDDEEEEEEEEPEEEGLAELFEEYGPFGADEEELM